MMTLIVVRVCFVFVLIAGSSELLGNAEEEISFTEYFDTTFSHYSKMATSPISTCDKNQLKDICFWKNSTYTITKGSKGKRIGTIGPPQDPNICNIKNISYAVLTGTDVVKLYPPDTESKFWILGIQDVFSNNSTDAKRLANTSCSLLIFERTVDIFKILEIDVQDTECEVPEPQDFHQSFTFRTSKFKKGDALDNLIFLDKASKGENNFQAFIDDKQISDFLSPHCRYHADTRQDKNRTVIHCRLNVTKPRSLKSDVSFLLGLKNTNLACAHKNLTAYINVTFVFGNKRIKRSNIFINNSKIFRTAAPYARVTQPYSSTKNMIDYKCYVTNTKTNPLAITNKGIVYVNDTEALRETPEYLRLNITWIKNQVIQYEEVSVRVVIEPRKTCTSLESEEYWSTCASYKSSRTCLRNDSCGLGTGGVTSVEKVRSRCMWRGAKIPENHETHLYSTCTPDTKYCPDGECDSLEELAEDYLCPQDCTKNIVFPTKLNEITHRGVDKCNGVLVCEELQCRCDMKMSIPLGNDSLEPLGTTKDKLARSKNQEDSICGMECILLATGGVGIVIFVVFFSILLWRVVSTRKLSKDKYMDNLTEAETPFSEYIERNVINEPLVLNFHMTTSLDNTNANTMKTIKSFQVDTKWKFPRQQIFIEQVLGEGEFGKVLKAKAFNIAGRPGYSLVAVKTLKDDSRKQDYNDLFSEYQLLKEVNHPHVIQLLGVCSSEDGPLYIIIEYAIFGSLRNHLRRSRHILTTAELGHIEDNLTNKVTPRNILSFARQIASGMSYLSDIKLVHRDLAARNILLAENKVCKISDFGLTRDIYEDNAYFKKSKGRVPVKWMAPESLADHVYTTKSDVWSFGILIWELITLGASPYPGIPVHNLYNLLKQGYRMERPPNCSTVLYSLMNRCWNIAAEQRPSFLDLYHCFDNLLTDNVNYLDLSDNTVINKSYFSNFSIDADSGSSDLLAEKANLLKNNLYKNSWEREEKLGNAVEDLNKETFIGYETPVKTPPKPLVTPTNEAPGEYTDMNAKQQ